MRPWRVFLTALPSFDWPLMFVTVILMAIGLSAIYSVDLSRGGSLMYFPTQAIAAGLGVLVMFVAGSLHESWYRFSARTIYVGSVVLLVVVLFFGQTVRGTTGWFRIAGISFQPAEFGKVGLILMLALLIERFGRRFDDIRFLLSTGLFTLVPVGLIAFQPDAGTAMILIMVWLALTLACGTKVRYLATLFGGGIVFAVVAWFFLLKPYQHDRVLTFLHPDRDPLGAGYNVTQSMIAIGSGQWFGRGLGFGSQSQLHFLPEAQTDFIYAVIAEELGFVGVATVLALYGIMLYRLYRRATVCRNDFSAYTTLGIALLFFFHLFINAGGALGLLPLTGVTLPFLSYGGSSLLINCALLGIAQSISRSGGPIHSQDEG